MLIGLELGLGLVFERMFVVGTVISLQFRSHRIKHWATRIEQEIDRVFQQITGAQQLKGVSFL